MVQSPGRAPAYLITGSDPSLLTHVTDQIITKLCGDDRQMVLSEATSDADLDDLLGGVPLFTDYQVILLRSNKIEPSTVKVLLSFLTAPAEETTVVVSAEKASADLTKAVQAAGGEVISTSPKKPADAIRTLIADAPLTLDASAANLVVEHAGENVTQVPPLLTVLATAFGTGARITYDQVAMYLGEAGGVPPWDLTDAIDRRRAPDALRALNRMLKAGWKPLPVVSLLHNHINRIHIAAQSGLRDEKALAELLGEKGKGYPARKAIEKAPRWGDGGAALTMVAQAGDGLRGGSSYPEKTLLDVLVSRLAMRTG